MGYKVFDADGNHVAGDTVLDEAVKGAALLVNGWVESDGGRIVYESPRRREIREQEVADAGAPAEEERDEEPESLTGVVTPSEDET